MDITETKKLLAVIKIYIYIYIYTHTHTHTHTQCIKVYSLMSCDCSSVSSPAMALIKGKLPVQGLEGCPAYGSPTMQCGS